MPRRLALISLATPMLAAAKPDFNNLDIFLQKSVEAGTVAGGSVLILHKGKVLYHHGFGFSDLKAKTPFPADAPVIIASISKPILATAAFRLVESKQLDMAAPISKYLESFQNLKLESGEPLNRTPTTGELFTHTSGMRNDEAPGGRPWFRTWVKGKPLSEVVDRFAKEFPFKNPPGTHYAYSGIGTDVAARIMEVASGQTRNKLLLDEVAKPLDMTRTFYLDATSLKQVGSMPSRYYHDKQGNLVPHLKRFTPPPETYSPSGGTIISNAPDLANWLLMIRNHGQHDGKEFLAPETINQMLTRAPKSNNAHGGLFVRKKDTNGQAVRVGHTGSSGTNCWIDFENDIIGIVLTQTSGQSIPDFRPACEKLVTESILNNSAR
jgi:CubicO group peptidase (beta-lactamase class C family)